jgi:hypothetical protein
MIPVYTLSYDSYQYVDNEKVNVYKVVRVGWHQVKSGMSSWKAYPEWKTGEVIRVSLEDQPNVLMKVLGNGQLRELTEDEEKVATIQLDNS